MLGDDPPYLSVGTEVSAKYKGAFCEAKIRKVVRSVKCRVTYKQGLGTSTVTDDQIKGTLRVGASVEAKHNDRKEFVDATITKIQDCSQYTVVFDDGDITTLRRTALCLKSGRHFAESETLDQLPLTHPEHFGNPVIGGRRGRRSRQAQDESSEDEGSPPRGVRDSGSGLGGKEGVETEPEIGRVVCVELGDKKKKDNWFPGLVVAPTAQDTVRIRVRDDYLVRSFKDARYYTVPKKEATEFTKELVNKVENSVLKVAVEKALLFLDKNELPPHWDRDSLFGHGITSGNSDSDAELDSDTSDDEPREEKDHFVAQLYKFMDDRGTPINNCPMIGSQDIDLYRLFRAVYKLGGYNRVTNQNQWKSITRRLGFTMQCTSSTTHSSVKQAYKKFLHSFEDFYRKLGCTMVNHPRGSTRKQRPGRSLIRDKDRNTPVPPQTPGQKSEKEDDEKRNTDDDKKVIIKDLPKKEPIKEEEIVKIKKKEELEESGSGHESDVNVEGEGESSSSEKSQRTPPRFTPVPSKLKSKIIKEEPRRKTEKPDKQDKQDKQDKVDKLDKVDKVDKVDKPDKKKVEPKKQEKKEDKGKEEEPTKTRSKSKDDNTKGKASSESRETRTPSREPEKKLPLKQRRPTEEELRKQRGRKRKENETDKSRFPTDEQQVEPAPCYKGPVELGDRLKVYYGPTHESKVTYEAKVIDMEKDGAEPLYLVHYTGWNTRYDEWIKGLRIAQNFTQAQGGRLKRAKTTPRPQTPSTTSSSASGKPNKNPPTAHCRRRAQSVVPSTSTSGKETRKDDKEKEVSQPPRSTTPSSVASSSSRTKSPATPAANRQTRATRNTDPSGVELRRRTRRMSGHTDVSVASESEDSDAFDSDTTEPEQARTRSRGMEERKRSVRRRAEDRIKTEEGSEGEEDKDAPEEHRRGRRLRRNPGKMQEVKSEPDSDYDQPKGRDFDLNQIRSELKGFDKAVKVELVRVEPDPDEDTKPDEKENIEKPAELPLTKLEKKLEPPKLEPVAELRPAENTEDIYEFKEPEPFEFEVRNKRDSGGEKDKAKKRVFDEEVKSPKKKQKTLTTPCREPKSEADASDPKKRIRRSFGKKPEETETTAPFPSRARPPSACEEAFDKLCESSSFNPLKPVPVVEETGKVANTLELLFSDLPGDEDCAPDDPEDRLIISETEVSEAEQENLFTYQQEIFPSSDIPDTMEFNKDDVKPREEVVKDEPPPSCSKVPLDKKQTIKPPVSACKPPTSLELKQQESKPMDPVNPAPVAPGLLTPPAPISARLPATSTIEEKLSAAAMAFKTKAKDAKKEDEIAEIIRKSVKETAKKVDAAAVSKKNKDEQAKIEGEKRKKQEEDEVKKKDEEQRREAMRAAIKQKEEELHQLKLKKEAELKRAAEAKILAEQKKAQDRKDEEGRKERELKEREKDKRKRVISQEFVDSTDSSDSEQRLVIDNEDPQEEKIAASNFDIKLRAELERLHDIQEGGPILKMQYHQQDIATECKPVAVPPVKTEEEGENMNSLLCEEEIPGSPAPPIDNADQPNAGTLQAPPKIETSESSMVLLEMPFASAPTSGQSTAGNTVITPTVAVPKISDNVSVPVSLPVQQGSVMGARQQQAPLPAQRRESNEAAPVMDNTPPTTPDSSISNISGSPREERTGGSSPMSEDNLKSNRDSSEADNDNDSGSKGPGFSEDDTLLNADGNATEHRNIKAPAKRIVEDPQSPKKRKRSRKHSGHSESSNAGKKPERRHSGRPLRHTGGGSDSDDTSESSNLCTANSNPVIHTNVGSITDLGSYTNRSPRPMKYNFFVELDPELDGSQRIAVLQHKLAELRKTYNAVKVELAGIERRRKKLRRREREALKAAKAEMQQACL